MKVDGDNDKDDVDGDSDNGDRDVMLALDALLPLIKLKSFKLMFSEL